MKMSRLPLAIALTSALALGVGCADRNDGVANTPSAADRADTARTQPAEPMNTDAHRTQAQAQADADAAYRDQPHDTTPDRMGDGRKSDQPIDDTWITTKVKSSLLADSDVAGLEINVDTLDGVVTLRGQVDSQSQVDAATRIARGIKGVTNVDASGLTAKR